MQRFLTWAYDYIHIATGETSSDNEQRSARHCDTEKETIRCIQDGTALRYELRRSSRSSEGVTCDLRNPHYPQDASLRCVRFLPSSRRKLFVIAILRLCLANGGFLDGLSVYSASSLCSVSAKLIVFVWLFVFSSVFSAPRMSRIHVYPRPRVA